MLKILGQDLKIKSQQEKNNQDEDDDKLASAAEFALSLLSDQLASFRGRDDNDDDDEVLNCVGFFFEACLIFFAMGNVTFRFLLAISPRQSFRKPSFPSHAPVLCLGALSQQA
jgi:hypothetical protein